MNRGIETNIGGTIGREESPDSKWVAWAVWSSASLAVALFLVLVGGIDPGLLLGWALGVIIAAMLMVFRR